MKRSLLFVLCLMCSSVAGAAPLYGVIDPDKTSPAQPIIYADVVSLGDGWFGYNVFLDDLLEDNYSAYFLHKLTFTGNIKQIAVGKNQVHSNDDAEGFDGFGGYDMTLDSYFFLPFTDNLVSTEQDPAIVQTANSYGITAGSGGGSLLKNTQIAYIVADGPIGVTGRVGRTVLGDTNSANFNFDGLIAVPEPTTIAMLALGALALLPMARVRRRR